jgi:hypothetical protein
VRQLSIFAPRAQGLTAYIERHRPDGALLPPAAEFPEPTYWLHPQDQDWVPVEEKNRMPHYKNGELAQVGDLVKGRGYNVKHEIVGKILSINQNSETCNLTVAHVIEQRLDPKMDPLLAARDGASQGATYWDGVILRVGVEYGQTDHFELVHREPEIARNTG